MGPRLLENPVSVSLDASRKASAAVKLPKGLEREVRRNYRRREEEEAWHNRERRRVEWVRFEIAARVEADQLKPLAFKKSRPILYWEDMNSNKSSGTWYPDHVPS